MELDGDTMRGRNKSFLFPEMKTLKKDKERIENFGVRDRETYQDDKGNHKVYAGGFKIEGQNPVMIARGETKHVEATRLDKLFESVSVIQPKVARGPKAGQPRKFTYNVFAHNLARFDGHFFFGGLSTGVIIEPLFKNETTIRNISRTHKDYPNLKIIRRDSNRICPGKLEKLAQTFECKTLKGKFPYKFVTRETVFYEGEKPAMH